MVRMGGKMLNRTPRAHPYAAASLPFISPDAAAILRRACSLALDADEVLDSLLRRQKAFDQDRVYPAISEIVLVDEFAPLTGQYVPQLHLPRIDDRPVEVVCFVWVTVLFPADLESMQGIILPTHDCLDCQVKLGKGDVVPDLEPAPESRK